MILESVQHRRWEFLEAQIEQLRSTLTEEKPNFKLAYELGMDLEALNSSEQSVLENAISDVQVPSKLWLLDELFKLVPSEQLTILVLGGWCGVLPWLAKLTDRGLSAEWLSIDIDPEACSIGRKAFGNSVLNLSFSCENIHDLDYHRLAQNRNLIVINTICEHLLGFSEWRSMIPEGTQTILQSNNFRGCPDHVNCVDSIEELVAQAGFKQVLYQGSRALSLFTRFMLIGLA